MYFLKFLSYFIEKSLKWRIKNAIEQSPWFRPQSPWNENQISLMSSRRGSHVCYTLSRNLIDFNEKTPSCHMTLCECTVKTLISLGRCRGWSESSLRACVILLSFSCFCHVSANLETIVSHSPESFSRNCYISPTSCANAWWSYCSNLRNQNCCKRVRCR